MQDLWLAHYQILPIVSLKEFIALKCNYGQRNTKCQTLGNKYQKCKRCLEYTNVKNDLGE